MAAAGLMALVRRLAVSAELSTEAMVALAVALAALWVSSTDSASASASQSNCVGERKRSFIYRNLSTGECLKHFSCGHTKITMRHLTARTHIRTLQASMDACTFAGRLEQKCYSACVQWWQAEVPIWCGKVESAT